MLVAVKAPLELIFILHGQMVSEKRHRQTALTQLHENAPDRSLCLAHGACTEDCCLQCKTAMSPHSAAAMHYHVWQQLT